MSKDLNCNDKHTEIKETTFVSIDEARRLSGGESKTSLYKALRSGELHAVKRGRRTLLTLESVRNRLRNLPKATFGSPVTTEQSIHQALNDGALRAKKIGRRTLITNEALHEWVNGFPGYNPKDAGEQNTGK